VTRYSPMLRAQLPGGGADCRTYAPWREDNATRDGAGGHDRLQQRFKMYDVLSLAAIPLVFVSAQGQGSAEPIHIE